MNDICPKKENAYPIAIIIVLIISIFFSIKAAECQVTQTEGLKLIGMIEGSSFGGAVFQDSSGKQFFFRIYEKLPDGSKIIKLRADSLSLRAPDGAVYDMFIARDTKMAVPSNQAAVSSNYTAPALEENSSSTPQKMSDRYRQARQKRGQRRSEEKD